MRRRTLFAGSLALSPLVSLGAARARARRLAGRQDDPDHRAVPARRHRRHRRAAARRSRSAPRSTPRSSSRTSPAPAPISATEQVVRAAPDGLTLLFGGVPNAINETLYHESELQPAARPRRRHAGGEPAERAGGQPERPGDARSPSSSRSTRRSPARSTSRPAGSERRRICAP